LLESWDRPDSVEGLEFCSLAVLEAVLDTAAAIKPQVAFFERFGVRGLIGCSSGSMVEARDADIMIVADAKRGDIALTNEGYAEAWLHDRSPLVADALTVSPYVGFAALAPIFDAASASGRGVFVLAATSNDDGRTVQLARTQRRRAGGGRGAEECGATQRA
jgi:orotidine-5'-phosphate decarboxylase